MNRLQQTTDAIKGKSPIKIRNSALHYREYEIRERLQYTKVSLEYTLSEVINLAWASTSYRFRMRGPVLLQGC